MHCIVGLGNPEERYFRTRHNIGFLVADQLADNLSLSFKSGKNDYLFAKGFYKMSPVVLVKPTTYMNRSGYAVRHIAEYFDIDLDKIMIVNDDLDLPFGALRLRAQGRDGGNKGLRSIIEQTGTDSISRLRIGIKNRDKIARPSSYVLSPFTKSESTDLPVIINRAESAIMCWMENGITTAMNRFNRQIEL